ncbi:MAG: triose-phosphate isomerase [Alphaproteobacteria bacterium]|nr:triose-phosphate isomerase [Alphaproteobacteria bacterium]
MKRRPFIAGNWKMNGTLAAADALAAAVSAGVGASGPEVAVCPPFLHLAAAKAKLANGVALGAQDVSLRGDGAFTGEISAPMLADMGCKYVIVGHSERRQYFEETDHTVAAKATKAMEAGVIPIICVGETLAQRQTGQTEMVIESQLAGSVPAHATGQNVVIAYEPVWAIGTGQVATVAQIAEVHAQIRANLEKRLADAGVLRIIYGGSVKPENASEILSLADVDGALVGGASLKAESFLAIVNAVKV